MKRLFKILGGGLGLLILVVLAVALIFTLGGPKENDDQEITFQSPPPSPTPTATVTPSVVEPNSPISPISTPTATATPIPTKTPMPELTEVELLEIRPLTFDDTTRSGKALKALLPPRPADLTFEGDWGLDLLGWTRTGRLVVQPMIPNTKKEERPVWTINPDTGQARPLPNWEFEPDLTRREQRIVDNFLIQWTGKSEFVRPYPSPSGKYLALLALQKDKTKNKLHIYDVRRNKELAVLPEAKHDGSYSATSFAPVWSPDGSKLAYGIAIRKNIYPNESYELHILDLDTGGVTEIAPIYYKGSPVAIS